MSKVITIKLVKASIGIGPFIISDQFGKIIAEVVSRNNLIEGVSYTIDDDITTISLESIGKCSLKRIISIDNTIIPSQLTSTKFIETKTACLWRHLTNVNNVYNNFYGTIEPYIIEYPFSYQYQDQILQSVKDYTKTYKYSLDDTGVFSYNNKVETDDYFNKAIVYNGQQCSGILELVKKPRNDMKAYMSYPIYGDDGKIITYTKSDNFYQYNTFWSLVKDKSLPLFINSCESLSMDKIVNQSNMDYGLRSFKKEPLRAKDLKVRHILDNRSDISLVSQFIVTPTQISYK